MVSRSGAPGVHGTDRHRKDASPDRTHAQNRRTPQKLNWNHGGHSGHGGKTKKRRRTNGGQKPGDFSWSSAANFTLAGASTSWSYLHSFVFLFLPLLRVLCVLRGS